MLINIICYCVTVRYSHFQLKNIGDRYFKCLAMYDENTPWNLHIDTMEKIINLKKGDNSLYVKEVVNRLRNNGIMRATKDVSY